MFTLQTSREISHQFFRHQHFRFFTEMTGDGTPRRSGRKRTTNAKYSADFTGLDLDSDDNNVPQPEDLDDDVFEIQESRTSDESGVDDALVDSDDEVREIAPAEEDDGDAPMAEDLDDEQPAKPKGKSQTSKSVLKAQPPRHNPSTKKARGVVADSRRQVKSERIRHTYGSSAEDLIPYIRNRDIWLKDSTLPSHFAPSAYHSDLMRENESTEGWRWYFEGGRAAFARHQKMEAIQEKAAQLFTKVVGSGQQTFLLGPYKSQKPHSLEPASSLRLSDAWLPEEKRSGYIINLGAKIQCLDWLPNNSKDKQFIAISSIQQEPHSRTDLGDGKNQTPVSPAFSPAQPYPASLQIWRINCSLDDTEKSAVLDTVLCFDWGDVRQIAWCPMPGPAEEEVPRGLLAGVWFDGTVRILDVELPTVSSDSPRFLHVTDCAFKVHLPQKVVPTCLTWLSTTTLAAGCANGHVAIWKLPSHFDPSGPVSSNPQPWFYRQIHPTYILSIASGYPSRPYLLITSGMEGNIRETDLRAPDQDFCLSPRLRFGIVAVAWHDRCQSALGVDELGVLRAYTARRFFQSVEVCRTGCQVTDVKTSMLHSSVLTAQLDGHVYVCQPMRKVTSLKSDAWRQTWFEYEWRRGMSDEQIQKLKDSGQAAATQEGADGAENVEQLRKPMGRFLDSHKPELVAGPTVGQHKFTTQHHTVFEEPTAIMQVAWNPNIEYGGWAAAGTGSGLVRIENLAFKA